MTDKQPKGRPIKNMVDPIPASAEKIAQAIFRGASKKNVPVNKPKKKPN